MTSRALVGRGSGVVVRAHEVERHVRLVAHRPSCRGPAARRRGSQTLITTSVPSSIRDGRAARHHHADVLHLAARVGSTTHVLGPLAARLVGRPPDGHAAEVHQLEAPVLEPAGLSSGASERRCRPCSCPRYIILRARGSRSLTWRWLSWLGRASPRRAGPSGARWARPAPSSPRRPRTGPPAAGRAAGPPGGPSAGAQLPPIAAGVVDVHVEPVLVAGVPERPEAPAELTAARAAEVAHEHGGGGSGSAVAWRRATRSTILTR